MTKKAEARQERKLKFIESLKRRQTRDLIEPLAKKIDSFMEGKLAPEDLFKAIHYVATQSEKVTKKFRNRPDVVLAEIAMDENKFTTEVGDINIKARLGDVLTLFVDAIVNPADPRGVMTQGDRRGDQSRGRRRDRTRGRRESADRGRFGRRHDGRHAPERPRHPRRRRRGTGRSELSRYGEARRVRRAQARRGARSRVDRDPGARYGLAAASPRTIRRRRSSRRSRRTSRRASPTSRSSPATKRWPPPSCAFSKSSTRKTDKETGKRRFCHDRLPG